MAFTGQLGTSDSQLGWITLGGPPDPAAPPEYGQPDPSPLTLSLTDPPALRLND